MATESSLLPRRAPSQVIDEVDKLYGAVEAGHAAESVRLALDPIIERRLGTLLDQFVNCAPDLATLLDYRAQIKETWRMRKNMAEKAKEGKDALSQLKALFEVENKASL